MPIKKDPAGACEEVVKTLKVRDSKFIIEMEKKYGAHNYHPLSVVFSKAKGIEVRDPEGRVYYDFLSGYGAVSHGHLHPRILAVARRQLNACTLSSRAFHNDIFGVYASFITKFFGYDMVLPMNTGAEGVETALKLARRWGYEKKLIPKNEAIIVCCTENFHGRTFGAITLSDDPASYDNYGPLLPGIMRVVYGNAEDLEKVFNEHGKFICGFIVEPIQGEAGIKIPPSGYFKKVRQLCNDHNILFIADEVQSGIGRTGKMLAIEHEGVRPDVLILAKALGAGLLPVSAVLADKEIMEVFTPGTHGSTFGGNPFACAVAIESLRIMHEEKLPERSAKQGAKLIKGLQELKNKYSFITEVRGRGLFCAMDFDKKILNGKAADIFMYRLKEHGLLAKTTHSYTIRLTPPLIITDKELSESLKRIDAALKDLSCNLNSSKL